MQHSDVITRFAPSPTGFLHIGGARTALFCYLFARNHGGQFKLRIEDTDRARSTDEAVEAILAGLTWLGLDWDGDPVSQFSCVERHKDVVDELLEKGAAFKCFMTAEETEAQRNQAFEEGRALRSPWRDRDLSEAPSDASYTVRFRAPDSDVHLKDEVQGDIHWASKEFDDLILLRADGSPTYNLAVVVDDHDMGVTHIIRGDDHLVNAARQTQIYQALDWPIPVFAHIPLIHGPDGKKLSKRHGALGVEAYAEMGYLPEGIRNYLLRLGWAKGDQEIFSDDEMIAAFDLEGLNKSPARLDFEKMASINAHHMKLANDERLTDLLWGRLQDHTDWRLDTQARAWVVKAMPVLKERAKTLKELEDQVAFLLTPRPFKLEGKAAKPLQGDGLERLARLRDRLAEHDDWSDEALSVVLQDFAASEGVGFGKVGQPLRAALTGGKPAPDMSFVLQVLGQQETLDRLGDLIS